MSKRYNRRKSPKRRVLLFTTAAIAQMGRHVQRRSVRRTGGFIVNMWDRLWRGTKWQISVAVVFALVITSIAQYTGSDIDIRVHSWLLVGLLWIGAFTILATVASTLLLLYAQHRERQNTQ